jgi:hypothetical protein
MKPISRLFATLTLPFLLSGCELITNPEFEGSLTPLSDEQAFHYSLVSSSSEIVADINQAATFTLTANGDCSQDLRTINFVLTSTDFGPGTGSLAIDDNTFDITHVACESLLTEYSGVERFGSYIAQPANTDLSPTPEVLIYVIQFSTDITEFSEDGSDAFAGNTTVLIMPLRSASSIDPDDLASPILLANYHLPPMPEDPANTAQQVLTQAGVDLEALITDEFSYTNWILYGALFALESAANDRNWEDDGTLNDRKGRRTYRNVAIAVNEIERIADSTNDGALMASLDAITTAILESMRTVATNRIDAAVASGGDAFRIDRANYRLVEGDTLRSQDQLRRAVKHYGRAWRKATRAMR